MICAGSAEHLVSRHDGHVCRRATRDAPAIYPAALAALDLERRTKHAPEREDRGRTERKRDDAGCGAKGGRYEQTRLLGHFVPEPYRPGLAMDEMQAMYEREPGEGGAEGDESPRRECGEFAFVPISRMFRVCSTIVVPLALNPLRPLPGFESLSFAPFASFFEASVC